MTHAFLLSPNNFQESVAILANVLHERAYMFYSNILKNRRKSNSKLGGLLPSMMTKRAPAEGSWRHIPTSEASRPEGFDKRCYWRAMDDDLAEEGDLYMDETEETTFETGQIMRVFVQDFMCHNKLTIDFGRHVNFVTGANGSGACRDMLLIFLKEGFRNLRFSTIASHWQIQSQANQRL